MAVKLNDKAHAARFARKMHTTNPAAFVFPQAWPLGLIKENGVRIRVQLPAVLAVGHTDQVNEARLVSRLRRLVSAESAPRRPKQMR
jgi:L-asparaginase